MTLAVTEAAKLSLMIDISAKAVDYVERQHKRRWMQNALNSAYAVWKKEADIVDRIERDTEDWKRMMGATAREYEDLEEAKRQEKNAQKRLRSSVFKYKAILDEEAGTIAGLTPVPADENNGLRNADIFAEHFP